MNYIKENNLFYDWLETNPVPTPCIALWHALMNINNKAGWRTEFTVAISTLEVKTGLKKAAIIRARARLQQLGRLDFKSRSGQQSALYKMIPLEFEYLKETQSETQTEPNMGNKAFEYLKETQSGTQTSTQTSTQTEPQSGTINKLNNTKLENTLSSSLSEEEILLYENVAVKFFVENMHKPKSYECEILKGWLAKYSNALIIEAMKIAIKKDAGMDYINVVLLDWEKAGVTTPEAVMSYIESWKAKKKQNGNITPISKNQRFTNISSHDWDFDELEKLEREYIKRKLDEVSK